MKNQFLASHSQFWPKFEEPVWASLNYLLLWEPVCPVVSALLVFYAVASASVDSLWCFPCCILLFEEGFVAVFFVCLLLTSGLKSFIFTVAGTQLPYLYWISNLSLLCSGGSSLSCSDICCHVQLSSFAFIWVFVSHLSYWVHKQLNWFNMKDFKCTW